MKLNFKIQVKEKDKIIVRDAVVEKYDDLTYYLSPRFKGNENLKYAIYDKNTGLAIALSTNKADVIKKYESLLEAYKSFRESKAYEKMIKEYKSLCEKVDD